MSFPERVLVFQTAFIGDVILTLPILQTLRERFPQCYIATMTIPQTANLLENHPAVNERMLYDKKGTDRGVRGIVHIAKQLRERDFDLAIVPHRSLRSAVLVRWANIPRRIGFSTSSGNFLFTESIQYRERTHEIMRNLSLLQPLGISLDDIIVPSLYPSAVDRTVVDQILRQNGSIEEGRLIAVAPGSVWRTKRWLEERFVELVKLLLQGGHSIALVGGRADADLCARILNESGSNRVLDTSGKLSLLQSAELIRRCRVTISNDSAPMHLSVAMRIPVLAIFGATVPEFGFAPVGKNDQVVQTHGLVCRPCSIHGGNVCPIRTFDCMKNISAEHVFERVRAIASLST